jgi:uncharacterized protein (DUF302 family)
MKTIISLLATVFLLCSTAFAAEGLITKTSNHSVKQTLDNLEKIVKDKGFTVFIRINHAEAAMKTGSTLRPTEVLIFGKPKLGSLFMQSNQTIGIDLPVKVIAWEDEHGVVNIGYNDPAWLAGRHNIKDREKPFAKMAGALKKLTSAAAK